MKTKLLPLLLAPVLLLLASCGDSIEDRIPNMRVYINLADAGAWNTYGVSGFGMYRTFIRATGQPSNFHYTETTYTGFGGVLLISGQDPYTCEVGPLAYDLACPVERNPDVRVVITGDQWTAKCPVCGSEYNVVERGGMPISGQAYELGKDYHLLMYQCLQATTPGTNAVTGYIITNR